MPQWAGSCWYELRYLDPANHERFVDPENEAYWMGPRSAEDTGGVDLYVGGVEHAVLHLLYSRFWHKVLFDLGHVSSAEPFRRLFNQGYIQAYAFRDGRGQPVPAADVVENPDGTWSFEDQPVTREYGKMGKSLKNMVTPDEMYDAYGADTFRVYEMSMGPLDVSRPWETRAVVGSLRFLQRLWRNVIDENTGELRVSEEPADLASRRALHHAIDGISRDLDTLRLNTAVAKLIELNNTLTRLDVVPRELAEPLVLMTAPLAPHLAEALFAELDKICPPHTILATNSSYIVSSKIADATARPDKVCNMHFFNPALVMKLVEVVQGSHVSDETVEAVMEAAKKMSKTPVLLHKEIYGFLVNRFLQATRQEALKLLDMGVASYEDIDLAVKNGLGYPMGPFELLDLTGVDLAYHVGMEKYRESGDPADRPSPTVVKKYSKGEWGKKVGKGFYDYQ